MKSWFVFRFAAENGLIDRLQDAVRLASVDSRLPPVDFDELIRGIEAHMPRSVQKMAIDALPHPRQKSWRQLIGRLQRAGIATDEEPLCIHHLPRTSQNILAKQGVGASSISDLRDGMWAFCVDWPKSAGHYPRRAGDAEVRKKISSGIDELDDLFG